MYSYIFFNFIHLTGQWSVAGGPIGQGAVGGSCQAWEGEAKNKRQRQREKKPPAGYGASPWSWRSPGTRPQGPPRKLGEGSDLGSNGTPRPPIRGAIAPRNGHRLATARSHNPAASASPLGGAATGGVPRLARTRRVRVVPIYTLTPKKGERGNPL